MVDWPTQRDSFNGKRNCVLFYSYRPRTEEQDISSYDASWWLVKQYIFFVLAKYLKMSSLIKSLTAKEHEEKILDIDSILYTFNLFISVGQFSA